MQDEITKALRMTAEADILAFDVETTGVDWKHNMVIGYAFSDGTESLYIPVRHGGGGNIPGAPTPTAPDDKKARDTVHPFEKELALAFAKRRGVTVGHHLKFDIHMAMNHGVQLNRNLSCTQNNQVLIDDRTASYSLDAVAAALGTTAKKGDEMYRYLAGKFGGNPEKNQMGNYWRLPGTDKLAAEYAAVDAKTTWEVYTRQLRIIIESGLDKVFMVENALIWTLVRMERRGMKLNLIRAEDTRQMLENDIEALQRILPEGFNPRSPKQVMEYVSQGGRRTDWPLTEKGNPSFPKSWLIKSQEGREIVQLRETTNLRNTFLQPLVEVHAHEGRIHASIHQNRSDNYGTISGRLSCSHPNLQQVPKHNKKMAISVRRLFVPDEGCLLYEGDYSQVEPRLFAHYSQDKNLLAGYNADPVVDVHSMAAEILQQDRATKAKRMNMGMFTGMRPLALAGHMEYSLEEAERDYEIWSNHFPGVLEFQAKAKRAMLQRGYVKTLLGRRAHMESPKFAYKAVSRIIQGTSADIMKLKMVEIDSLMEGSGDERNALLMSVHDSAVWQVAEGKEGEELSKEIVRAMEDVQTEPFNLSLPFKVDIHRGRDWAEASFGATT